MGDAGQHILAGLKIGIIGLGGGGSMLNQWLAHLGVGHIVGIDFDWVTPTNLPRIVGATRWDTVSFLTTRQSKLLRRIGTWLARPKVVVARRAAKQANPTIRYDAVVGSVLDEPIAKLLVDADFLYLASDSIQSRLVFNALVHPYLIPGIQVGAKVAVEKGTGRVGDIFVATRPVLPTPRGGCLDCHQLIPASRLQDEALSEGERRAQRYVEHEDVAEPSVITLNVLSARQAANDLMMMIAGLYQDSVELRQHLHFVRERTPQVVEPRADELCLDCGASSRSRRARGDRACLPCRVP